MGGGGTAYLTGYEAAFINPANLAVPDKSTRFSIGIGTAAGFFAPVMSVGSTSRQFQAYKNYLDAHQPEATAITASEKQLILDRNYPKGRSRSEHQHRMDLILGGVQWRQGDRAFSLTARTRFSTRTEVGRGWYDETFEDLDSSTSVRDVSLFQQSQFLHEFSFGYGQTFDFVSGLIPRVGKLYIGIAPKFILGGSYLDLQYDSRYWFTDEMDQPLFTRSFSYRSTGNFSGATRHYTANGDPSAAVQRHFPSSFQQDFSDYTTPTGMGGGLDFGLVYVLTLGDDLSLAHSGNTQPIEKSLRLGFSVTDLGFVSYNENPRSLDHARDTTLTPFAAASGQKYEGSPGQYLSFFDEVPDLNPFQFNQVGRSDDSPERPFKAVLPTSFNAGMLLQVNRLKLAADLTLGLNDSAFNNTKLIAHFGMEFAPVKPVPIRLGAQVATDSPTLWSLGTGIVMKHWELSAGAQFLSPRGSPALNLSGAAVGGLTFHF
ncbi:DUF5723 family protein [Halalkalibaculum sp. DA384]|uniref:DUF5723 family protein n=1 Tax=Halalkalibaculum sp. DA384 TaxID=3373606 RepID=UPI003754FFAF